MAAFNYIEFNYMCPNCFSHSKMKAQTHIASDYEGDETGRFMERTYQLGEKMAWYDVYSEEYIDWMTWGKPINNQPVTEYCHTSCMSCQRDLYSLIEFQDITPVKIIEIGLKEKSPIKI